MWLINDKNRQRKNPLGKYLTISVQHERIRISKMLVDVVKWNDEYAIDIFMDREKIILKRNFSRQGGFLFRTTAKDKALTLHSIQVAQALKFYGWESGRYDIRVEKYNDENFHIICYKTALKAER